MAGLAPSSLGVAGLAPSIFVRDKKRGVQDTSDREREALEALISMSTLREGGGVGGGVKKTNKVQGGGDCSKSEAQLWVCGENSWHQVRKLYGDSSAPKPLKYLDEGFPQSRRNNASGSSSSKTVRKKTQKGAGDHFMCENCGKAQLYLHLTLSHRITYSSIRP